jgi:hypothetical protein
MLMMTQQKPQTPFVPQLSETEAAALQHDSYVLQKRMNICRRCGGMETFTELYEVWCHPTRTGKTGLIQRRKCSEIKLGYPIASVMTPSTSLPVCMACVETYDPAGAANFPPVSAGQWQETLKRKYAPQVDEAKKPGKLTPSLDML